MSVDLRGNCGVCLYPLSNGEQIAYHETYTNESGHVCDGSKHPSHLKCAQEALEQSGIHCFSCKAPINLKSVGVTRFDHDKMKKDGARYADAGAIYGAVVGALTALYYFPTLPICSWVLGSDCEVIDLILSKIAGCIIGGAMGKIGGIEVAAQLLAVFGTDQFVEKAGWVINDNPGAKMITIDPKPL